MDPTKINEALREKGIRQIDVATRLGMPKTSRTIISLVIHGLSRSRRVEAEIGKILERPLAEVFPDWYCPKKQSSKKSRQKAA